MLDNNGGVAKNMAEKIEKKISRVMRWLERCALSCRGESYGSALMDIECARVDFDSARDEIWSAANEQYNPSRGKHRFMKLFRAAGMAAVILLSAAAPLSFVEHTYTAVTTGSSLEWVNPDEKLLLSNLRERLSSANSGIISDVTDSLMTDLPALAPTPAVAEIYPDAPAAEAASSRSVTSGGRERVLAGRAEERPAKNAGNIKNEKQIFTLL
ncbi:MAG: hypothetical protein FWG09_07250, partial [Synergistaceae bacterium]|nr:hypothetical protein [Synergistaceae bacterium]